ncbi:acyl-CoA dehydrogenase family protein [Frankia sp. CNm7]|uniref:Acyl-CoA dehydrogenase family protein n=1 Tax=Frankia nepalensis TaxID=1836974 RepID=A0A937RJW8_9ACTN|nr:acyl-CoA dehydrogenase family protein [Frankia nepalensis]MBL7499379.1 acyl-CoA dehydrogenase family protein [Frankia nepalensis]MBL7512806.1 acyl-CoA dehydrogenase family protein [Frankia nepalensis]MBL7521791.1 acyl-CoA dehydrogenase family protein [Frankia nepalensis]MBL7631522.1 acyl-CoA dehydrogenase family protein [Frankia nepalensis]
MDFGEGAELRALREAVAAIMKPYGGTYYTRRASAGTPTDEAWAALAESGFLGVNVPEAYGGGGGGIVELAAVCEEAAAAGCPLLLLLVSAAISGEVISRFGDDQQRRRWLPGLAAGSHKIVFAITEPDAGSNTHRLTTRATRDGSDWIITGQKYYISGFDEAAAVLVVARTDRDGDRRPADGAIPDRTRLSLFLVPTDAPGLVAHPLPVSAGLPEKQFTLFFDGVRVPADALVGEEGDGFRQVFHGLNPERVTGAALCVGIGRNALRRAAEYATARRVWDTPIGAHQGVSHPLAVARIEVELAGLMTQKAAWQHDNGVPAAEASNMAKYAAAEAAVGAVNQAIQTHGGNGMATEFGLVPLWGLARLLRIAPVSREMILNYVAQHSLGLPRSY